MKLDTPVKDIPKREFEDTQEVRCIRATLALLTNALRDAKAPRVKAVEQATELMLELLAEERLAFDMRGERTPEWRGGLYAVQALDAALAFLEGAVALHGHYIRRGFFQAVSDELWVVVGSEFGLRFGRSHEQFKPIVVRWGPQDLNAETAFRQLNHERDLPNDVREWAKLFITSFAQRVNRKLVNKILTYRVWPKSRPNESVLCRGSEELDAHLKRNGTQLKRFTGKIAGWSMPEGWYEQIAEVVNVFDDGSSEAGRTVFWETATPDFSKLKY